MRFDWHGRGGRWRIEVSPGSGVGFACSRRVAARSRGTPRTQTIGMLVWTGRLRYAISA